MQKIGHFTFCGVLFHPFLDKQTKRCILPEGHEGKHQHDMPMPPFKGTVDYYRTEEGKGVVEEAHWVDGKEVE